MSRLFCFALLFLSVSFNQIVAQHLPPILQASKPKKGIYTCFEEFLNNSPSIDVRFELESRSKSKQFWEGGSDYGLFVFEDNGVRKKANKYWGVSDGDSVYVNVSNYQQNRGYIKLLALGRYCYTKGTTSGATVGVAVVAGPIGGAVGGALASIPREAAFIFNINNGKFVMLDREVLSQILERDAELMNAYDREERKRSKDPDLMLSYIEQFNRRHPDEIRREPLAKVVIYRREKKERPDTVSIVTGDSLKYSLGPVEFTEFSIPDKVLTLCLLGDCKAYQLDAERVNYFQCTYREGDNRPMVTSQESKVGEYYLRETKYLAGRRKAE